MVQTYKGMNKLDALATRSTIQVTRELFGSMPRAMTSSQLAEALGTSRSSIKRAIERLERLDLVRTSTRGRLVLQRINTSSPLAGPLFDMFNHERYLAVGPKVRETLDRIMAGIDTTDLRCVILFGSHAKGTARRMSDIDLCFVWRDGEWPEGFQPQVRDLAFPRILVEPHCYSEEQFRSVPDLVVLDSILFGISLSEGRYLLSIRSRLDSIRKMVLLARLDGCRRLLEQASSVMGEVRGHLRSMVDVGLTEVESVLHDGVTLPRSDVIAEGDLDVRVVRLTKELALEGDLIRLT